MSQPNETVLCDIDSGINSGIATLTLNRPERNNGWTGEMQNRYIDLLWQCNEDPNVRAIVVTGAGRSFCPGADMNNLAAGANAQGGATGRAAEKRDKADAAPLTPETSHPAHSAALIGKPVVGAINGACAGVGLVQAMLMDVRFAVKGAKFTMAFSQRGLVAEYGAAWLLPRLVGRSRALDLLMSSRVVLAEEAKELGLINFVSESAQLLDEAKAYAHDLATKCSPQSMAVMKRQIWAADQQDLPTATAESLKLMAWSLRRPDFKEGVTSFLDKRLPDFAPHTGKTGDPYEM